MSDPNFSGVEPTRLAEAKRRIEVIERYLAISKPSSGDTLNAACSLGLTRWQFCRLVTAWRDHRDPSMVVTSRTGSRNRDYGIDERAKDIARLAINRAGLSAEISNVAPEIEAACRDVGIEPPSRPTIYNYILAERRAGHLRFDDEPCLFVGRMWFHLPLCGRELSSMPAAVLAVAMPERVVVAHAISMERHMPPPVVAVVATLLQNAVPAGQARALRLDALDIRSSAKVLSEHGLDRLKPLKSSVQRLTAQAFGDRLGPLQPVYHPIGASAKPSYRMGAHDRPLSPEDATAVIERAITENNGSRTAVAPYWITSESWRSSAI